MPTLVQGLVGHMIIGVELGSGDAHTLALEDNGEKSLLWYTYKCIHQCVYGGCVPTIPFPGTVWSWGDGDFGKLGRGGSEGSKVPKTIPSFGDVTKIRCGRQFSIALTKDGKVFTW